jgi:hypothetical protein
MRRVLFIVFVLAILVVWALRRPAAPRDAERSVEHEPRQPSFGDNMAAKRPAADAEPGLVSDASDAHEPVGPSPTAAVGSVGDGTIAEQPVSGSGAEPVFDPSDALEAGAPDSGTAMLPIVLEEVPAWRPPQRVDLGDDSNAEHPGSASFADPDKLLAELAQIRAEVVERVDRRPLFIMAGQRGVPHFRLISMTKPELFEAVLDAEGVPPSDVRASPETAERVRALAAEAFRIHHEVAAEESANRTAS